MLGFSDRTLLKICFYALSFLFATNKALLAQIASDNSVGTQVNNNGNVAEITGGETRGGNLFHSFQDFSVPTNNEAFFNNGNDIINIFSRVTGGNVSNIDGLIRTNGSASLFLINPAGIIFGENASLNTGGSFYGSTADSILFEDGQFSADLDNPVSLTVNAPIGLSFRDNPGDITAKQSTLLVNSGRNLVLLGGNLNFEGTTLGGLGSSVKLGGLTESGTIDISSDGGLSFPDAVVRGNVSLDNSAQIFVAGDDGGSVDIAAKNLSLNSDSEIFAGIGVDLGSVDAQAGDIAISLTEDLVLNNSTLANSNAGKGNAGNIMIEARNLTFNSGGKILNFNSGEGNIGKISIFATQDIAFDGAAGLQFSGISNTVFQEATGSIGDINLTAQNLTITDGASIANLVEGNNDSGSINLNIANTIEIDGFGSSTFPEQERTEFPSNLSSLVVENGSGGEINIDTQNLLLSKNGQISSTVINNGNAGSINIKAELITIGEPGNVNLLPSRISAIAGSAFDDGSEIANGGNITINTDSLRLTDGGDIDAGIAGSGNGGNIVINASKEISVRGSGIFINGNSQEIEGKTSISSDIFQNGRGEAGDIKINTALLAVDRGFISADVVGEGSGGEITISTADSIAISDKGYISADVFGEGNGGEITISAADSIAISGKGFISADVLEGATGNGGNLNIETGRLTVNDGSQISAVTFGNGDAGNILIRADESIGLSGISQQSRGGIFANALIGSGRGGNIKLVSDRLTISDGAIITVSNFPSRGEEISGITSGTGEPGNIKITADSLILESEGRIEASTQAEVGQGANINLQIADSVFLSGSSFISAEALNNADGGNISINTDFILAFPNGNNDIIASADRGRGGNIDITAESLLGIRERPLSPFTNDINASSEFGLDGSIFIRSPDFNPLQGASELPTLIVGAEATTAQICSTDRDVALSSGLLIGGKGGIPPAPDLPLESTNVIADDVENITSRPESVTTSAGKIQPARGIKVTATGEVILTAYRIQESDRLPTTNNCRGT